MLVHGAKNVRGELYEGESFAFFAGCSFCRNVSSKRDLQKMTFASNSSVALLSLVESVEVYRRYRQ